jgi:CheY-like chemotaxis protein
LGLRGFRVQTAADGPAALAAAAADRPDVVLTDLSMPGMTGWELAGRLRALYPESPPEVVAVTGRGSTGDRRKSAAAGIRLHLVKPADPTQLVAYLEGVRSVAGEQAADGGD